MSLRSGNTHNPFPHFTGKPPESAPATLVRCEDPRWDQGSTYKFTSSGAQAIARRSFDKPRSMVAYAFWDPYKNNPGATADLSTIDSAGVPIYVLGRLSIGSQGAIIEYNFDIPWGQMLAIPFSAEQAQLTARLVRRVNVDISPNYQDFNDPPDLTLAAGVTLPNAGLGNPQGFVAITGMIGDGSSFPNHAPPVTRTRLILSGGAGPIITPIAYGARRVTIMGNPALFAGNAALLQCFGQSVAVPFNTPFILPVNTVDISVTALAVAAACTIIFELGL